MDCQSAKPRGAETNGTLPHNYTRMYHTSCKCCAKLVSIIRCWLLSWILNNLGLIWPDHFRTFQWAWEKVKWPCPCMCLAKRHLSSFCLWMTNLPPFSVWPAVQPCLQKRHQISSGVISWLWNQFLAQMLIPIIMVANWLQWLLWFEKTRDCIPSCIYIHMNHFNLFFSVEISFNCRII